MKKRGPNYTANGLWGWERVEPPKRAPQVATTKQAQWAFPHYSDPMWNEPQTVYGAAAAGLNYNYDDRLRQWDVDAWERGRAAARPWPRSRWVR